MLREATLCGLVLLLVLGLAALFTRPHMPPFDSGDSVQPRDGHAASPAISPAASPAASHAASATPRASLVPSPRVDTEYLVLLRDHPTGPLLELQVATLRSVVDACKDGSRLRNVYAIDLDQNSHVLHFHLSATSLRRVRAHPYVALVEEAVDLPTKVCSSTADNSLSVRVQCSGTKVAVSARFVDVAVEQPNAGERRTVTLLEYKGGFYIALPTDSPSVSTYKCPTRNRGTMSDIETTWFAIRFNPQDLTVNTGDYTFVTSTGYNTHHKDMGPDAATHVPFATCFGCEAPQRDDGRAVVDLHGTPFVVLANQFKFAGWLAFGTWTYSNNAQLINLTGGGYCGWTAPLAAADNEVLACNGGWHLQLGLVIEH